MTDNTEQLVTKALDLKTMQHLERAAELARILGSANGAHGQEVAGHVLRYIERHFAEDAQPGLSEDEIAARIIQARNVVNEAAPALTAEESAIAEYKRLEADYVQVSKKLKAAQEATRELSKQVDDLFVQRNKASREMLDAIGANC